MVRIAQIGAGRIGVSHAALVAAHPRAVLSAVIDADAAAASLLAARHGAKVRDWRSVLADPEIDAVLIASSTDTHAMFIEEAARAGKAILAEKPIDLSLDRIDRCLAVVAETGARLMVGFNRRFDPDIMALKARLDEGAIGRPVQLLIINRDAEAPPAAFLRRSGGIFRDMAIHDYDLARHLLGEEPVAVRAGGSALVDEGAASCGDFDTAHTVLTMPSGAEAVILNARCARFGFDYRVEILGSKGALRIASAPRGNLQEATAAGIILGKPAQNFFERFEMAFVRQFDAFVNAVAEGRPMPASGADGRAASAIAEAAARSARKDMAEHE
ncbi:MAG TPA: Gfo/Idh/MocA family oxidoreductase [Acetobacteraceae bacterium]|nr:Gfo/Idh/MocA family oxidoreductase [Acetobacteraceae bacterium]